MSSLPARISPPTLPTQGKIGGDSSLSPHGRVYADKLAEFMNAHYPPGTELAVWTSCLKRTVQTAEPMGREIVQWKGGGFTTPLNCLSMCPAASLAPSPTRALPLSLPLSLSCCPLSTALDEINAGICDGMTYEEIAKVYPAEYAARAAEKFKFVLPTFLIVGRLAVHTSCVEGSFPGSIVGVACPEC
jgi:6-phosphofructo-2-kinase/fructose-2,6-biphosphatase 2